MSDDYTTFLESKEPRVESAGKEPGPVSPVLFPWQADVVRWAIRLGRAALFCDTGLGKTFMQIEWARQFAGRVLLVAPLGVTEQTTAAGRTLGVEVCRAREVADVTGPGLWITNYERLERFADLPWDAIVLDESSIMKSVDGKTRSLLLERFTSIPHRLCCTATPAPNDETELAQHAEFLGAMSRAEMLAAFFVHDSDGKQNGAGGWRLKGHAREAFFRWMAKWAVFVRRPSDLGYSDEGYVLPPLSIKDEVVLAEGVATPGQLFAVGLGGIGARSQVRKATLRARVERARQIIAATPGQWLVWCGLNPEGRALEESLGASAANIEGATPEEKKLEIEAAWRAGAVRALITKAKIFGFGLNWQHCNQVLFLGLGDSYEAYYQATRRCWRFGQKRPVDVRIVISDAEGEIAENVRQKERAAAEMAAGVVTAMREVQMEEVRGVVAARDEYRTAEAVDPAGRWRLLLGDCVERIREVETESVGLSVFSPPFSSLYTYSPSSRDMGNCRDDAQFIRHFRFLIRELLRITKPGRLACVHVQQLTNTKATHGEISLRDFRGLVIRAFQRHGWLYNNDVTIDKDPQAQAIRTKSHALLFVTKNKDSSKSRPALADYVILFKKPGVSDPVTTDVTNEEWIEWARPIWRDIRESDTLRAADARESDDEKHICPLQLGTIRRCVRLWSNRGDLVFSPFAGIGSEGYVALEQGRRFVGIELKWSYWEQARRKLGGAAAQKTLFADEELTVAGHTARLSERKEQA